MLEVVEQSRSPAILESSISRILRLRLPWLLVALAGGMLAGGVIEAYEDTLEAVVALAFFVPVIMGMGGGTSALRRRRSSFVGWHSGRSTTETR